jgi:hypothetical protein
VPDDRDPDGDGQQGDDEEDQDGGAGHERPHTDGGDGDDQGGDHPQQLPPLLLRTATETQTDRRQPQQQKDESPDFGGCPERRVLVPIRDAEHLQEEQWCGQDGDSHHPPPAARRRPAVREQQQEQR